MMNITRPDKLNPRKRKREHEGVDALSTVKNHKNGTVLDELPNDVFIHILPRICYALSAVKSHNNGTGLHKLPDDVLIHILSRMSIHEAGRTSVLSRRWGDLWKFTSGTLEFDDRGTSSAGTIKETEMKRKKFEALVNFVLKLHQGSRVDSLIIRFARLCRVDLISVIDSGIYFAMHKEVRNFELNFQVNRYFEPYYEFPSIDKLLILSHGVKSVFGSLTSLRLVGVPIKDEVVHFILASCPNIRHLCIRSSASTKNLEVVDPLPNLKVLEIIDCWNIKSLDISAINLVCSTYEGRKIPPPFKKAPSLSELTLGGEFCMSFCEPEKHSSYSVHLVKLVLNLQPMSSPKTVAAPRIRDFPRFFSPKRLEVNTIFQSGRSLLFFILLIKASPHLQEFKIKIAYLHYCYQKYLPFPSVGARMIRFRHKNLKVVEVAGYTAYPNEEQFLQKLVEVATPSLEMVAIDTQSDYYVRHETHVYYINHQNQRRVHPMCVGAGTREESKCRVEKLLEELKSSCASQTKFIVR